MDETTQKELLEAAKKALAVVSITGKHEELVYELRDIIRKAEGNGPK
jgi:methylmalonyl-CoA mutase cobalamin-binding subunit